MHKGFKRFLISFLLTTLMVFLLSAPVYAHRMIVEQVEEGIVKVIYDGGRIARRAEVVVYDDIGIEIAKGSLDENGHFQYPLDRGDVLVVADDGLGHRAEWKTGDSHGELLPRAVTIALVLLGFVAVAVFFNNRVKKKEDARKQL
ncbi:hypothetical protein [Candidatus Contubernalis alkaliaceticus]|uniref:hypothetical protein n=1 Tax=Candidatus Contubernalis alkaliaceticus TaxID=338645 RepID=UPI001F4C2BB9|nr:hypothetical protein [Candidatus Contubernalis alkalaceticus]UNC93110.1 hypothetical protein HUE98_14050 [Candidatus Contubernalis alkalaceticus]